ncbi:hypothetical protein K493DRAFT_314432 [Basidiobolus meristosporus CBS 931.73]|uniref:VTT domain-containing protein n=1 Tax=Basidiobolus meristosporus CBS 931.73 TaxID=1314790 RepID=A0A1Y1YF42_9FUNG|nr:hypothetical protein K493DRAFT_314432 [Basidiobolus meristosporus CBS 931.73]|eukprot:ORX96632.1 hypothetical protein K493DRAFT_314432 [Basidiobolus meristosporus CBS 931.73]
MRLFRKYASARNYEGNHKQILKWLFRGVLVLLILGLLILAGIYASPHLQPFLYRMQQVPLGWLWVTMAYIPLVMVFAPRSLVGSGVGFVFGPALGLAIDISGFTLATMSIWVVCQALKRVINVGEAQESSIEIADEEGDTDTLHLTHFKPPLQRHDSEASHTSQTSNISAFSLGSEDELLIEEPAEASHTGNKPASSNSSSSAAEQGILKKAEKRFRLISRLYERVGGWKLVLFANISPAFPVSLTSYILSFTNIPFYQYQIMTILSNIPYCVLYVMIGASARSWADLISGQGQTWWQWLVLAIGLGSTVGFIAWLGKLTVKYSKELDEEEEEEADLISDVDEGTS